MEQPKINVQTAPIIDLKKPLVKKNKQTKQGRDKCGHIFFYLARIPQMSRKCLSTMRDELHPISPAAAPNKISIIVPWYS